MDSVISETRRFALGSGTPDVLERPLKELVERFDDLMSFGLHAELCQAGGILRLTSELADLLERALNRIGRITTESGPNERLEQLAEMTRDCTWQIREEVLRNVERVNSILPETLPAIGSTRSRHFVAWAVELVMENLDRLEVRGRDSAGISVQCLMPRDRSLLGSLLYRFDAGRTEETVNGVRREVTRATSEDDRPVLTFVYKIANLVGRLGDNTAGLRNAVRGDDALWEVAAFTNRVNIMAHTRWASNGIISLANCHPADGTLAGIDPEPTCNDREALFVLNGDVDNYHELVATYVHAKGCEIHPSVTTDAKILPLFYRLGSDPSLSPAARFTTLMNNCDGSLAVVMQHPRFPHSLFLGQKGSGQSLFVGAGNDGLMLASEVYGLASRTRRSYALVGTDKGGSQVILRADQSPEDLEGRYLAIPEAFRLKAEQIYIHSRDIYRGNYDYYFEKEINEAPASVRKTIKGKYRKVEGKIAFNVDGRGTLGGLLGRLRDPGLPPIRRIMVIGQGTASVAAKGVAYLLERALARTRIGVSSSKASEMSGFLSDQPLSDMLLIAISQSGTTTDTNRTVDVAGAQGAWIHAIVNRRNSPLVSKSDSHLYTSDGRDVEMAVASTKAFYSQITAGKLVSLLLAQEMKSLSEKEIALEIEELERLPSDIEWVLNQSDLIRECAEAFGPGSRNWAVVGNGPNKIAADEIRIKLSELCYKSIPCDFTEDKKHIDLSTEPATIVVANDLPEQLVQDTAKEVAIFKAHNGKPIVFCARGEERFREHAERVIELPLTGAGLGFVSATVAGHLWGFHAAKAIDASAEVLRNLRALLGGMLDRPETWDEERVKSDLDSAMNVIASGAMNASLPASTAAALAMFQSSLSANTELNEDPRSTLQRGIVILNQAVEDMTRPIDTIRHQAKTVTVGISRPQEVLPPLLVRALRELSVSPSEIREPDRRVLGAVSSIISLVEGGLLYRVLGAADGAPLGATVEMPYIRLVERSGMCVGKPSRYDEPRPAGGSKRTALRLERCVWTAGPSGEENLVLIPLFDEQELECRSIVLFHLAFVAEAPVQQKLNVLRALGNRYDEMIERLGELSPTGTLEQFLEGVSPRDLVLAPVDTFAV